MPDKTGRLKLAEVVHLVGTVLLGVSAALGATGLAGWGLRDGSAGPLFIACAIGSIVGASARQFTPIPQHINYREAFVTVSFSWISVALLGALPFYLSGSVVAPAAALFESMSGFTTTGSTVLPDIESVAPGILLWRSVTQWLGGMGFIVLGVAILPYLGVGGMQLFRLESPGPTSDRLRPRIRETARLLWAVYAALTGLLFAMFWLGGMTGLEALNHALTTMPTGGFSTRQDSMGAFPSHIQWITIFFMYVAGISFPLHYRLLGRGPLAYWRDPEWKLYTGIILGGTLVVGLLIRGSATSLEDLARDAMFQVVSIVTTTGYGTSDFALWAPAAQIALFLLFFVGGMAGSTSGGPKVIRVHLVFMHAWLEIRKQLHPNAVFIPKVGGRVIQDQLLLKVLGFVLIYIVLFGLGTLFVAGLGLSTPAAAGAAATSLGNIGPGLAELGPAGHFGFLPWQGHLALAFLMLVGRLELYTVLLLFHPGLWRR